MAANSRNALLLWLIRALIGICLLLHIFAIRAVLPSGTVVEFGQGCVSALYGYRARRVDLAPAFRPGLIPFLWPPPRGGVHVPFPVFTVALIVLMVLDGSEFTEPHRRGYCKACGHRIRGLSQPRCPECGRRWGPISKLPHVPLRPARRRDPASNENDPADS